MAAKRSPSKKKKTSARKRVIKKPARKKVVKRKVTKRKVTKKKAVRRKKVTAKRVVPKKVAKKTKSTKKKAVAKAHKKSLKKVGFSLKPLHLGMHAVIALSAVGAMFVLGAVDTELFQTRISDAEGTQAAIRNTATIGLEYERPLTMSVLVAKKADGAGYYSISNDSNQQIVINVPSDWLRQEVSGASLDEVVAGVPTFGFTSWTLPPKAGVKFSSTIAPQALFFDTASEATAAITLRTVELNGEDSNADGKVILLKKKNLVQLWLEN